MQLARNLSNVRSFISYTVLIHPNNVISSSPAVRSVIKPQYVSFSISKYCLLPLTTTTFLLTCSTRAWLSAPAFSVSRSNCCWKNSASYLQPHAHTQTHKCAADFYVTFVPLLYGSQMRRADLLVCVQQGSTNCGYDCQRHSLCLLGCTHVCELAVLCARQQQK